MGMISATALGNILVDCIIHYLFYKYRYIYKKQDECAPFILTCWKYWIAQVF